MSDLIRPRTVSEIVDAAFQLYRRAPVEFMTATALIYVPYLVLQLVLLGGRQPSFEQLNMQELLPLLVLLPAQVLVYILMEAPLLWLASELYLGRPGTALDAWRAVGSRLVPLVFATIARYIMVGVGYLFFIVPGVYITALTFAVSPVVVIERGAIGAGFARSQTLSRELKWHILGASFLALIIMYAILIGAALAVGWVHSPLLQQVTSAAIMIVIYPIVVITKTVLYYDSRIRREGFDVEWMAASTPAPSGIDPSVI